MIEDVFSIIFIRKIYGIDWYHFDEHPKKRIGISICSSAYFVHRRAAPFKFRRARVPSATQAFT